MKPRGPKPEAVTPVAFHPPAAETMPKGSWWDCPDCEFAERQRHEQKRMVWSRAGLAAQPHLDAEMVEYRRDVTPQADPLPKPPVRGLLRVP